MKDFFAGLVLTLVGVLLFFQNVTVDGFNLWRYHNIPFGGLVIVIFAVSVVLLVAKPNVITGAFATATLIALIIILILSVNIYINRMPALMLLGIVIAMCAGVGLIVKSTFQRKKK